MTIANVAFTSPFPPSVPKSLKVANKPRDGFSGVQLGGLFYFLCLFFEEGGGKQITYSLNKII